VVPEAQLEHDGHGLRPVGEGWFVLNVRDARWFASELDTYAQFESDEVRFDQVGIGIGILSPGKSNGMYHGEDAQEDFLVLSGECLLIVEGEERRLKAWDFVHCPPWTKHTFVGAGDGPCAIVMAGSRAGGFEVVYAKDDLAARHGASVPEETSSPDEAYAHFGPEERVAFEDGWLPS
jgi:uncharacterized cupin superfamily protein